MKHHRFDVLSFTAGAAFVALAIALLVGGSDTVRQAHWLWPAALLAIGASGLAAALRRED